VRRRRSLSFDLAGTTPPHSRAPAGRQELGPKSSGVNSEDTKTRSSSEVPDRISLTSARWGCHRNRLAALRPPARGRVSSGCAREIALTDPKAEVLGAYPDGSPAIVLHRLGKGRVITFAANPFAPQVTVDASAWPAAFKGLQQSSAARWTAPSGASPCPLLIRVSFPACPGARGWHRKSGCGIPRRWRLETRPQSGRVHLHPLVPPVRKSSPWLIFAVHSASCCTLA